ncbi:MAG: DUF3106 domain-containing protein [Planctomycetota bacterium]
MIARMPSGFAVFAAAAGCLVALAVWGRTSEEKQNLQRHSAQFTAMSPDRQSAIRRSFDDLGNQSPDQRREFEKIHAECENNPELKRTLEDFYHWWTALPQSDRNQFRELSVEQKLAFVEAHASDGSQLRADIVVEFPGTRTRQFDTLNMSFDEYWTIISETLEPFEKPTTLLTDLEQLPRADQKSLRLTMWFFVEHLREAKNLEPLRVIADRCPEVLEKRLQDRAWAEKFEVRRKELAARPFGETWLRMMSLMVIDGATLALGNSLQKEFPVTEDQILNAFASMQDKDAQFELMKMRADEARSRLELLAQSGGSESPMQRLLSQYQQFASQRRKLMKLPMNPGDSLNGSNRGPATGPAPQGVRGRDGFERREPRKPAIGNGQDTPQARSPERPLESNF